MIEEYLGYAGPCPQQRRGGLEYEEAARRCERRPRAVAIRRVGDTGHLTRPRVLHEDLPVAHPGAGAAGVRPVGVERYEAAGRADARVVRGARASRHLGHGGRRDRRTGERRPGRGVLAVVVEEAEDEDLPAAVTGVREVLG